MTNYATKYRPTSYDELFGHEAIVRAFRKFSGTEHPHTMLLVGPSGVGKTTIARIFAREVGCAPSALQEINAAKYTGVDDWRVVLERLAYSPQVGQATVVIVDECQMLSKSAWNVLLKATEEPPPHVYWVFCTTESGKVPATIRTRAHEVVLERVKRQPMRELIATVVEQEQLNLPDGAAAMLMEYADGSPRQALTGLGMLAGASGIADVRALLQAPDDVGAAIDLCRLLFDRKGPPTWAAAMEALAKIESPKAESVRRVVTAYGSKVSAQPKAGPQSLSVLQAFVDPYPATTDLAPLLISIGKVVYEAG